MNGWNVETDPVLYGPQHRVTYYTILCHTDWLISSPKYSLHATQLWLKTETFWLLIVFRLSSKVWEQSMFQRWNLHWVVLVVPVWLCIHAVQRLELWTRFVNCVMINKQQSMFTAVCLQLTGIPRVLIPFSDFWQCCKSIAYLLWLVTY